MIDTAAATTAKPITRLTRCPGGLSSVKNNTAMSGKVRRPKTAPTNTVSPTVDLLLGHVVTPCRRPAPPVGKAAGPRGIVARPRDSSRG